MIEIVPVTAAHIVQFYGQPSDISMRAFSVFYHGELSAIAGVSMRHGWMTFFSDVNRDAPKLAIWKASKEIVRRIKAMGIESLAVASPAIENSGQYLERLGFTYSHDSIDGKVYRL